MSKKILLVSNMYPSKKNPSFGVFVREAEVDLISFGHVVNKVVISNKKNSKIAKLYEYLCFYFSVFYHGLIGNYDYIYLHFVSHSSLPVLLLRMLGIKAKVVSHVHGGDVKFLSGNNRYLFWVKRKISKSILHKSDFIIFPSKSYMDMIVMEYSLGANISKVVYPSGGIPDEFFTKNNKIVESKTLKIGYAGRLVKSKNVDVIVKALPLLDGCTLDIVGDGVEKDNIFNISKSMNLSDQVLFYGAKSKAELIEWYNDIDILVYPSDSESLGLVPLEALASGCYTVLSDIPAFKEFLDFGVTAAILDRISEDCIVSSIQSYRRLSNCDKNEIARKNRMVVESLYSKSMVREEINSVFK